MSKVLVHEPCVERAEKSTIVTVDVTVADAPTSTVRYVLPPVAVQRQQVIDAMFVVGRLVAMKGGWTLVLPGPVSARLLDRAETFQDIFLEWFGSSTRPIPLELEAAPPLDLPAGRGAISTFSGGVDSYFTVLENLDELTGLTFVHGLDIGLGSTEFRSKVRDELATSAADLDLPLWEVETDVRGLTDPYASWGKKAHGAILSSVAILLAELADTFLIPGSFTRGALQGRGWGSHILIDPLNSTDYLTVVHDGVDTPRPDKTARIAESDSALRHLRVCYRSRTDYNCGRCSKCRRTQIDLDLAGHTDVRQIFAEAVPLETALAELEIDGMVARAFAQATLVRARSLGRGDVVAPLKRALSRHDAREARTRALGLRRLLLKDQEFREAFRVGPRAPRTRREPVTAPTPPAPTLRAVVAHHVPDRVLKRLRGARRLVGARLQPTDQGPDEKQVRELLGPADTIARSARGAV
jgi:hypothetical protein